MTPPSAIRWHKRLPMPLSKLIGGWYCIRECGWHYTWHHFWGKVGRLLKVRGIMTGLAEKFCAYAHELHHYQFRSLDGLSAVPPAYGCDAVSGTWCGALARSPIRRVAVVALYSGDGRVSAAQVELVCGVAETVDRLVVCGDCLLEPDEARKLLPFATVVVCERHGEYDFGSYRRGVALARREGWLDGAELADLVLVNDASYGPIHPLEDAFRRMARETCDFWGQTSYAKDGCRHVQSYFYVFRRSVIASGAIGEFLDTVGGRKSRQEVIDTYELGFTRFLEGRGFTWRTLVPYGKVPYNPCTRPLTLLTKYKVPFVKRKAMIGECDEDPRLTFGRISRVNERVASIIRSQLSIDFAFKI